jgi:hypothetical protein
VPVKACKTNLYWREREGNRHIGELSYATAGINVLVHRSIDFPWVHSSMSFFCREEGIRRLHKPQLTLMACRMSCEAVLASCIVLHDSLLDPMPSLFLVMKEKSLSNKSPVHKHIEIGLLTSI